MSTANHYNLSFHVWTMPDGLQKPGIGVARFSAPTKNYEIARFMEANDVELTQDLIDEINALDFDALTGDNHLWGGNEDESAELRNHPPRVVFNAGREEVEVPLADFLQLLQEWKAFLESISGPHLLSGR